jgi:hypothetical protein
MMNLSVDLIPQFKHKAPEGMRYEVEEFKRNVFSIWLYYDRKFDYNLGKPVKCIWGFYNYKKCEFYSPVNSSTVGKEVKFKDTRPWTSMPIKYQGLEAFFV